MATIQTQNKVFEFPIVSALFVNAVILFGVLFFGWSLAEILFLAFFDGIIDSVFMFWTGSKLNANYSRLDRILYFFSSIVYSFSMLVPYLLMIDLVYSLIIAQSLISSDYRFLSVIADTDLIGLLPVFLASAISSGIRHYKRIQSLKPLKKSEIPTEDHPAVFQYFIRLIVFVIVFTLTMLMAIFLKAGNTPTLFMTIFVLIAKAIGDISVIIVERKIAEGKIKIR